MCPGPKSYELTGYSAVGLSCWTNSWIYVCSMVTEYSMEYSVSTVCSQKLMHYSILWLLGFMRLEVEDLQENELKGLEVGDS